MKYQVNHRCDTKELHEMTDDEFNQVINRCPIGYSGASSIASRYVSYDIWDEMGARYRRKRLLEQLQQGVC